ncbi:MAG: outer membrane beta-barrel protein [Deltaproteobacteria bacterium]|nr:outer membrane beta-barrel protein [Deltaproteobacteria bacterium]
MRYQTKESENKSNILYHSLFRVSVLIFSFLFFYSLLPGTMDVKAQESPGETKDDFLFQKPRAYLGFRLGAFFPDTDSRIFDMITYELTLEKGDFDTLDLGVDLGFSIHERFDLVFSLDTSEETKSSEFRDYVDDQGFPITQSTKYSQTPITAGIRYLLVPRGRQVGQYAWIPSRFVPYLSAGAGILSYKFEQTGDFIDYETMEIFPAVLKSSDNVWVTYLGCGADYNIYKSLYLTLDFRYSWADDHLDRDFTGFDPIDLNGIRLTTGIQWHF